MKLKDNTKKIIIAILIPLGIGLLASLLTRGGVNNYTSNLIKPSFAPPRILFPIVWTILYILMGYSSYLIYESMSCHKRMCLMLYVLNLFLNFMWTIIFFNLEARLFAFLCIILLDIVVLLMIYCFHGIDKIAAYLNIPYFIWLLFATILNFSFYILNR
ncbi:MAG: tryptophan-rich sensory protein [Bacilli bacterium]|nr:tryptophan-rich sensory protein [Bacilli bacterium]